MIKINKLFPSKVNRNKEVYLYLKEEKRKWRWRLILMAIPYFLLYVFYVVLTLKERNEYLMAQEKGMDCVHSHDDSYFIYGSATKFYFDPSRKPVRRYSTWKEFWKSRGY